MPKIRSIRIIENQKFIQVSVKGLAKINYQTGVRFDFGYLVARKDNVTLEIEVLHRPLALVFDETNQFVNKEAAELALFLGDLLQAVNFSNIVILTINDMQ
jgi:hypothetical protein